MAGSYSRNMFNFLRNHQFFFSQNVHTNLHSYQANFSSFTSSENLGMHCFFSFSHLKMSVMISHFGLICIMQITVYTEQFHALIFHLYIFLVNSSILWSISIFFRFNIIEFGEHFIYFR